MTKLKTFSEFIKESVTFLKMKDASHGVAHVSVDHDAFDKNPDKATFDALKKEIVGVKSLHKLKVLNKNTQNYSIEVEFKR